MMKANRILLYIFTVALLSCNDESFKIKKHLGLNINNKLIKGTNFTNSAGESRFFCSAFIKILNDTTIPIKLKLKFSDLFHNLDSSGNNKFRAILLPDSIVPERQYNVTSNSRIMTENLQTFLNDNLDNPVLVDTIINPGDLKILNVGLLFNASAANVSKVIRSELILEGQENNLINTINSGDKNDKFLNLNFLVGISSPSDEIKNYTSINCGQIEFLH